MKSTDDTQTNRVCPYFMNCFSYKGVNTMKKGLSASQFTHLLAEIGGGAKYKGGGGMEAGVGKIAAKAAKNAINELMKPKSIKSKRA